MLQAEAFRAPQDSRGPDQRLNKSQTNQVKDIGQILTRVKERPAASSKARALILI